jgi:hypothetical protein
MAPSGSVNLIDVIKRNASRDNEKRLNDCSGTGTGAIEPSEVLFVFNTLPVRCGEVAITRTSS